jgi:hypothetical protein
MTYQHNHSFGELILTNLRKIFGAKRKSNRNMEKCGWHGSSRSVFFTITTANKSQTVKFVGHAECTKKMTNA